MFEKIIDAFLEQPRRLIALGEVLINISYWVGMAGAVGILATKALGGINSLAPHARQPQTLAEIYPALPTGWIPESLAGAVFTVAIFLLGLWLKQAGRQIERLISH